MKRITCLVMLILIMGTLSVSATTFGQYRHNKKGINHYLNGEADEAITQFSEGLTKGPKVGELYNNLGNVFYKEKSFDKAREAYSEALGKLEGEKKSKVHYNLGNVAYHNGDLQGAAEQFKSSLKLNAKDQDAKANLEMVIQLLKKEEENKNPENEAPPEDESPPPPEEPKPELEEDEQDAEQNEDMNRVLDALEQKEKEARQKYLQPPEKNYEVELDW